MVQHTSDLLNLSDVDANGNTVLHYVTNLDDTPIHGEILKLLLEASRYVKSVRLFDEYQGKLIF